MPKFLQINYQMLYLERIVCGCVGVCVFNAIIRSFIVLAIKLQEPKMESILGAYAQTHTRTNTLACAKSHTWMCGEKFSEFETVEYIYSRLHKSDWPFFYGQQSWCSRRECVCVNAMVPIMCPFQSLKLQNTLVNCSLLDGQIRQGSYQMTNYNISLQNIALKLIASSYRMKCLVNVQRRTRRRGKRFNSRLLKREFAFFLFIFFIYLTHFNGRTDHNSGDKFTHIKRLLGHCVAWHASDVDAVVCCR